MRSTAMMTPREHLWDLAVIAGLALIGGLTAGVLLDALTVSDVFAAAIAPFAGLGLALWWIRFTAARARAAAAHEPPLTDMAVVVIKTAAAALAASHDAADMRKHRQLLISAVAVLLGEGVKRDDPHVIKMIDALLAQAGPRLGTAAKPSDREECPKPSTGVPPVPRPEACQPEA